MTILRTALIASLALVSPIAAQAAECKGDRYLFIGEQSALEPDLQMRAYFPEGQQPSAPVRFEGWYGKDMAWRVSGRYECGNGVAICTVSIPLTDGKTIDAIATTVEEKGAPVYLTLAAVGAGTYSAQTKGESPPRVKAEWKGEEPEAGPEEPSIVLPDVWKVSGCRK